MIRTPPIGDQSIAYRTFRHGALCVQDAEFVVTVVRRGRGLALLFTSTRGEVFPEAERVRLAGLMADRLPPA